MLTVNLSCFVRLCCSSLGLSPDTALPRMLRGRSRVLQSVGADAESCGAAQPSEVVPPALCSATCSVQCHVPVPSLQPAPRLSRFAHEPSDVVSKPPARPLFHPQGLLAISEQPRAHRGRFLTAPPPRAAAQDTPLLPQAPFTPNPCISVHLHGSAQQHSVHAARRRSAQRTLHFAAVGTQQREDTRRGVAWDGATVKARELEHSSGSPLPHQRRSLRSPSRTRARSAQSRSSTTGGARPRETIAQAQCSPVALPSAAQAQCSRLPPPSAAQAQFPPRAAARGAA